jgi:hypothetical protein
MRLYFGGGLNEQAAPHIAEAATGSHNFELSKDTYQLMPRKVWDLEGTLPNGKQVNGIMQLITRAGNETTIVEGGGIVYRWSGSSTFTAVGSCATSSQLRDTYWPLDDYILCTDIQKATVVKKWDGTTFSTASTGLASSLYAKYGIVHLGRMWLFNVTTSTDTPHLMVASAFEDATNYSTTRRAGSASVSTGLEAFYMLTPDLKPINGAALFHGDLVISTQMGRLFKLSGSSALDFAWNDFYAGSDVISSEAMVNIGNDIAYMRRGGNVELMTATQNYGDTAVDDVSRYIPQTVNNITSALAVYDQSKQKVFWFVTDKILVLFKDILYGGAIINDQGEKVKLSPWSVYKTQYSGTGLTSVAAAKYMRIPGTTTYTVYFGDDEGRLINMNGTGASGDIGSSDIVMTRKTRSLDERHGINVRSHITHGQIEYRRTSECDISLTMEYGDSYTSSSCAITLKGPPTAGGAGYYGGANYYGGSSYYSAGFSFANNVSHQRFSEVGRGSAVSITISSQNSVQYNIDSLDIQ